MLLNSLSEKYKNAYYQTAEKEIAQNAEKLGQMRKDVMQESIKFQKADRVVENIISRECEDRKELRLCLAKATIEGSKELLSKHLYDTVNHYNLNCYEVKKRQKILMDLMQTLRSVKKETQFDAGEHNDLQIIRQIENKIEKMDTKVQVAKQIYQMYQNILECLQRDAAYIPQRVDSFSAIVDAHKAELTALAQVSREAAEARKNMWIELDVLEKSYSTEKKERETLLSNRRKLLNLEKYALKRVRIALVCFCCFVLDCVFFKECFLTNLFGDVTAYLTGTEYGSRVHTGAEISVISEINKLKELMTCSKIQDIEQRINMQGATSDYLQWKLRQRKEKRNQLNKDLDDLLLEHAELKFDPNKTIARYKPLTGTLYQIPNNNETEDRKETEYLVALCQDTNRSLNVSKLKELVIDLRKGSGEHIHVCISGAEVEMAGTEQQLKLEKEKLANVLTQLCNSEHLLLSIENGIDNLYYTLYGIPGTTEMSTSEPQDTYEKLQICEEKLIFLENKVSNFVIDEWMSTEQQKLTELIEKTFGENEMNRNVMVDVDDFEIHDDLDFLAAGTDGILTREEIKRRSELLVQDKTRIVRRVKKKGRKRYRLRIVDDPPAQAQCPSAKLGCVDCTGWCVVCVSACALRAILPRRRSVPARSRAVSVVPAAGLSA
ncbi:coiled-coil domain-containing protein 183-like [Hemiscyllium ocellatum]|uniref:coiled-coil domain-containing protein 183-like n=1 Tax=Hemiscyllium ocellatum TaxID=170820 RepID=UPI0029668A0F|nr:coiled-coil domain-containing protein 183-like [Hemiscyllium ocellatum]